jgi:hypothetical protein
MVKISQKKEISFDQLKFGGEYDIAKNAARAAGLKHDIDPEAFMLVQMFNQDQYDKGIIKRPLNPAEIGRMMAKTPVDKNELKNLLSGTANFSQTGAPSSTSSPRTKSIFVTNPPPGTRVEFGKTEGMTDDELITDYIWLVAKRLEKHDRDGALDWNEKAQEKLSPEAYKKFDDLQAKVYEQYDQWEADHPEQVAKRDKLRAEPSADDNDPFKRQSPGSSTTPGSTSTTPGTSSTTSTTGESSGLDRWVNKAENIYKKWSDKNMPENSTAPALIKDVLDYMIKLKNNMPSDKASDAQAKIDKVQSFIDNIRDRKPHTRTVKPYSEMTGFGGKEADPFGRGKRLDQRQLDYLAQQESKSY